MTTVSLFVEFLKSLSIANIYLELKDCSNERVMKEITCESGKLTVKTVSKTDGLTENRIQPTPTADDADNKVNFYCIDLPKGIRLLPNTCSSFKPFKGGCLLRINVGENDFFEDSDNESWNLVVKNGRKSNQAARHCHKVSCGSCGECILNSEIKITSITSLTALGLPQDSKWENLNMTYFCHDHDHGENGEEITVSDSRSKQRVTFQPQQHEVFDFVTYYILSSDSLDHSKVTITLDGIISCARCHLPFGEAVKAEAPVVKIYADLVDGLRPSREVHRLLVKLLNESGQKIRRFCIASRCITKNGASLGPFLLLWIMDQNLIVLKEELTQDITTEAKHPRRTCKVLYKLETGDETSPHSEQWKSDASVKQLDVNQNLFLRCVETLTKSTSLLPSPWQNANGFLIGYIDM